MSSVAGVDILDRPPQRLPAVRALRWAAISVLTAAPAAWFVLRKPGDLSPYRWDVLLGVLVGTLFWAVTLTCFAYRAAKIGRESPNPTLLRGARIQIVVLPLIAWLTNGIGLFALYFPIAALAVALARPVKFLIDTAGLSAEVIAFLVVMALTIGCGAVHLLVAMGLGALFSPIEPSVRRRLKRRTAPPQASKPDESSA